MLNLSVGVGTEYRSSNFRDRGVVCPPGRQHRTFNIPEILVKAAATCSYLVSESATTLLTPETWRMSEVNSETYSRCRCCRADQGGERRWRAVTKGL